MANPPVKPHQQIELNFMGQKMVLKSGSDSELIQEAVDLATLKLKDAEKRSPGAAAHQVALLALMDLAEEYVRAKRRASEQKKKIEKRTSELMHLIDSPMK